MTTFEKTHKNTSQYGYEVNALLATVDINMENIKERAILDSGATAHFLVTEAPTSNVQTAINPPIVRLPDGAQLRSTATCILVLPQLPAAARKGHIIPCLASHTLLSDV